MPNPHLSTREDDQRVWQELQELVEEYKTYILDGKARVADFRTYLHTLKSRVPEEAAPILLLLTQLRHSVVPAQFLLNGLGMDLVELFGIQPVDLRNFAIAFFVGVTAMAAKVQKDTLQQREYSSNFFITVLYMIFHNATFMSLVGIAYSNAWRFANPSEYAAFIAFLFGGQDGKDYFAINLINWSLIHIVLGVAPNVLIQRKVDKVIAEKIIQQFRRFDSEEKETQKLALLTLSSPSQQAYSISYASDRVR